MSENGKKWYVLRTAGGKEKKAKEYLEKEIERFGLQDYVSQVLVPTEKVYKIRDGKRVSSERLFYPGYVLIEAELTGELQYIIRNEVPHMSGFLTEKRDVSRGNGKTQEEKIPIPLRESEVKRILGEQDEIADKEGETVIDYTVGEAVKITDGPFSGFDGTVKRSYRVHQTPDQRWRSQSITSSRTGSRFKGVEHHGFLQTIQRPYTGQRRQSAAGCDYSLQRQVFLFRGKTAACSRTVEGSRKDFLWF